MIYYYYSKVLAKKGSRNIPGRVSDCRVSVSVLDCISAAGQEIPHMAIVKVKPLKYWMPITLLCGNQIILTRNVLGWRKHLVNCGFVNILLA